MCVCLREKGGGHTKAASLLHAARKSMSYPVKLSLPNIFTSRKRSLGQGNVFTPVCQSFCSQGRRVWPIACWDTFPRVDTSLGRHPSSLDRHPLVRHPLPWTDTLLWADTHLYASYWNAYLLFCRFVYFRKARLINLHTCNMQQIYRTNRSLTREICLEIIRITSKSRTING